MRFLIGIDDTDSNETIGTGELLENLCAALSNRGLGRCGLSSAHQLYNGTDIPYTSCNQAFCCDFDTDDTAALVSFCRAYMKSLCAPSAAPGLCIIDLGRLTHRKRLIRFGQAAKKIVLTKRDAVDVAVLHGRAIYLSEHGGSGRGMVGALAGCGLRLSGFDGTLTGILEPSIIGKMMTVGAFCSANSLSCALDEDGHQVMPTDTVCFDGPTQAVLWNHKPIVRLVKNSGDACWRVCGVQELNAKEN